MAYLSALDIRTIGEAFNHGSGYVMDFTTPDFDRFFRYDVGIPIDGPDYRERGDSKGKRFACFLDKASEAEVHKALSKMWGYRLATGWKVDWKSEQEEAELRPRFDELLARFGPGAPKPAPGVEDLDSWHSELTKQLRKIQALAFSAFETTLYGEDKTIPADVKQALSDQFDAIWKLLPEDFPPSAIHNMSRHIGFCMENDMRDIAIRDAVDVQEKADRYLAHHKEVQPPIPAGYDARALISELFRETVEDTFAARKPDFHMMVLKCCLLLGREFGTKTGMEDDLSSYGKAFNIRDPMLLVPPDLETETHRSMQQGAMFLFQGYRSFLRNTHAHDIKEGERDFAMQAVVFLSILVQILESARKVG